MSTMHPEIFDLKFNIQIRVTIAKLLSLHLEDTEVGSQRPVLSSSLEDLDKFGASQITTS